MGERGKGELPAQSISELTQCPAAGVTGGMNILGIWAVAEEEKIGYEYTVS